MLFFFFFWFDPLFRLTNSKLVTLFALLLCASISHELRWHTVPDDDPDISHASLKNHDNHLHHVHEISAHHADESHQTNHTCDFFHGDLSEILHLSDTSISLIEKKARVAPEGDFSNFTHSFTYRARAPPAA